MVVSELYADAKRRGEERGERERGETDCKFIGGLNIKINKLCERDKQTMY
jgi:hypothetical protein